MENRRRGKEKCGLDEFDVYRLSSVKIRVTYKMKNMPFRRIRPYLLYFFVFAFFALQPFVFADGNISSTNKYAWAENGGWHNFRPSHGGVTVHLDGSNSFLSGYAWGENIGWVKLAASTNGPFNNDATNDWGVNMDTNWNLSGYAWNENAGWINFDSAHSQVTIDSSTGSFDGYAWGENEGWVHFKNVSSSNAYNVQTVALTASANVSATDGTYTDKVWVSWSLVPNATSYEVWRSATFSVDYASKLTEVSPTNYSDTSASPGARYYYWVRPLNVYGDYGPMSSNDSGYRALSPPAGVSASDGTYTNKIRVTWSASDGATSYGIYRSVDSGPIASECHTSSTNYDDTHVTGGVTYSYRIKAMNSPYESALSSSDTGYVLSWPSSVTASDGTYVGQVQVQWSSVASATGYEVWRADQDVVDFAARIGTTTRTNYTDSTVVAGRVYYYWLRAKNATATAGFSASDTGYGAIGIADLLVWDLVLLPDTIETTSHPSVVSFRMWNDGPESLTSPNTAVRMDFYASANTTYGDGDEIWIGYTAQDITLGAGSNTIVKVNDVSALTLPSTAGDYYIFVSVDHMYPSTLLDTNLADNTAMREGVIHVSESGSLPYSAINDYDGDGVSDLALYYGAYWYIRSVDGRVITYGMPWGTPRMVPVYGDYDGDTVSDLAVYGNGRWYARTVAGSVILWGANLGGTGFSPVYGDFSGSGSADLALYIDATGAWYIVQPGAGAVLWGEEWGGIGFVPVPGDYDGDGIWDMAVYNEETGAWYVRTVSGNLLLWGESWGGLGYEPVSGDFDGDGLWDMAVYQEDTGCWYIRTVAGDTVLSAEKWGETGCVPVYGDYNGDGISDMALYHEATGKWNIRSVDGTVLLWDSLWGAPGYIPVGR